MRNIQMAFFSLIFGFARYLAFEGPDTRKDFLHGFTGWVWVLVGLQAGGGLLVAAVIKYADNVLKGLATGVSVVFATLLSTVLFETRLSAQFALGASVILCSVFSFSNGIPLLERAEEGNTAETEAGAEAEAEAEVEAETDSWIEVEMKDLLPK